MDEQERIHVYTTTPLDTHSSHLLMQYEIGDLFIVYGRNLWSNGNNRTLRLKRIYVSSSDVSIPPRHAMHCPMVPSAVRERGVHHGLRIASVDRKAI